MRDYSETSSGLLVPSSQVDNNTDTRGFGDKIAVSTTDYRNAFAEVIDYEPHDEEYILTTTTTKNLLKERKPSTLIPKLIRAFPMFATAVSLYQQNINQGFDIDCEDTPTLEAAREVLDDLKTAGRPIDVIIEEQVFCMTAEGAISYEANFDDDGKLVDMSYVSPQTLTFRVPKKSVDPLGRYIILQKSRTRRSGDDVIVYDPQNPDLSGENRFFFHRGVNTVQGKPRGVSMFVSAIRSALSSIEIDNMFIEYLRGQAFPKGFLSPKVAELVNAGFSDQRLITTIKEAVQALKAQMDKGFELVMLGNLARARLDGATIVTDSVDVKIQIALDIPDTLLPSRKAAVLGEQTGRVQWYRWQNSLRNKRNILSSQFEHTLQVAVARKGLEYKKHPIYWIWDNTDRETRLYEAQAFREEMEAWKIGIETGIFHAHEARRIAISENSRFKDLDPNDVPEPTNDVPESIPLTE
ncbi:MAG: hypothetical protein F4166_07600 [Gammaproteobacteria bacterium]|nr:hypothetical protein [Gammaproteobacteria bacterium]